MNKTSREEVKVIMREVREKKNVRSSERVVAETFEKLGFTKEKMTPDEVLGNFNSMLRRLWEETLTTLESYEEYTYSTGIPEQFVHDYPDDVNRSETIAREKGFAAGVIHLLGNWNPKLRRAFQIVGQSRIARGGKNFELQVSGLFDLAEIPYDKQETTDHADFILPDAVFHKQNRTAAVIISVKSTLREHWTEVAEELFDLRTPNVFLFTADEDITSTHVKTICEKYSIHLIVWDDLKVKKFQDKPLVLGYTEWASKRLVMLRQFWLV
jgi:hypothetical protein